MPEKLKEMWNKTYPVLVAISAVLGLFLIGVQLYQAAFPKDPPKKSIIGNLVSKSAIITENTTAGLSFTVNGIKASNVYLNEVYVSNNGDIPISKDDFYESKPIAISFGESCDLLNISQSAKPDGFSERLRVVKSNNTVLIQPTLLNTGDSVNLKIITANCNPVYRINGSIEGISAISENWIIKQRNMASMIPIIIYVFVGMLSIVYLLPFAKHFFSWNDNTLSAISTILMVLLIAAPIFIFNKGKQEVNEIPEICKPFVGGKSEI